MWMASMAALAMTDVKVDGVFGKNAREHVVDAAAGKRNDDLHGPNGKGRLRKESGRKDQACARGSKECADALHLAPTYLTVSGL
jgi:hypothetical protein